MNAGGLNPQGAREAVARAFRDNGWKAKIATVTGDSIADRLDELQASGETLAHMDTGADIATVRERLLFASAYLGAQPIARSARARRRYRDHRPRRRCRALARPDHARARLALGRLGPARARADRRAPARMLRTGERRQLRLGRRVGEDPGFPASRLSDRRSGRRRRRAVHESAGHRRAHLLRHAPPAAALRGAQPARLLFARRGARHGHAAVRRSRPRSGARHRRERRAPAGNAEGRRRLPRRLDGHRHHRVLLARRLQEVRDLGRDHQGAGRRARLAGRGHARRATSATTRCSAPTPTRPTATS